MKSVVITGASTGIGEACASALDARGFRVFAGVRKNEDGERLRVGSSDRMHPVVIDVTDEATIGKARDVVASALGDRGLDGLVNNAGIGIGGPLELVSIPDVRRQFDVNVVGQIAVTQAFLPLLRAARGRIVFMGSISGRFSVPFAAPYSSSKHALEAIADALRVELRPWGIEVAIVEPGSVATPIWDKAKATGRDIEDALTDDGRALYGDVVPVIRKMIDKEGRAGVPPAEVAKRVIHALTAAKPKTRYLIGRDAKLRAKVAVLIPDRVRDRLIFLEAGLPKEQRK